METNPEGECFHTSFELNRRWYLHHIVVVRKYLLHFIVSKDDVARNTTLNYKNSNIEYHATFNHYHEYLEVLQRLELQCINERGGATLSIGAV